MSQNPAFDKLTHLLKELFQLNQPDLDFGFYRIMHAKAGDVTRFLEKDLLGIVRDAFGEADDARIGEAKAAYEAARKQAEEFGAPDPDAAPKVKEAKAAWDAAKESGSNEGDVYDHLYRFFERYYDNGDFMSRRYFARETDGKAAPYAVPYDGREVYLHWANRDQYYIKTSEYLTNFTFDPTQAKEFQAHNGALFEQKPIKVHCRIVSASEGEHNNVKASEQTERYFIIHEPEPVKIEAGETGEPELVIQFQYRPDPEKTGQDGTWRRKRLAEAADKVKALLPTLEGAEDYVTALMTPAPTESEKGRTLLEKYLVQYTGRNTMDYFIHKDLGGFLRRELDFYIKNEVMRLDDIESADAPRVEAYLAKVKVLRRIALHLIDFLAQLEDFQKRLWLKKKFVVDTQYCITLDRIPAEFYPVIAANEAQREEWVRLFAIDELEGYTKPLTAEFVKYNNKLLLDTAFFDTTLRDTLLSQMENHDSELGGILVQSDNFHALRALEPRMRSSVKLVYIDPPYNSGGGDFAYKDSYRNSSWLSMLRDRLIATDALLTNDAVHFIHIDDKDEDNRVSHRLMNMVEDHFGRKNYLDNLIWAKNTTHNDASAFSHNHEYILAFAKDREKAAEQHKMFRQAKPGFSEVMALISEFNPSFPPLQIVREALLDLYRENTTRYKEKCIAEGLPWNEETKRNDPWKGIKQYKYVEYRDDKGNWVPAQEAASRKAKLTVYREDNPSWPNASSLTNDHRNEGHDEYRFYKPLHPKTKKPCPAPARGWLWRKLPNPVRPATLSFEVLLKEHLIHFGEDENKVPQYKRFLHNVETDVVKSIITDFTDGEKQLANMVGERGTFSNPKPTTIGQKLVEITSGPGDCVIDFFAGSGAAGDAIIRQNRLDSADRRYILVEMGSHFGTTLRPRIEKSVYSSNWKNGKPKSRNGISHAFKYVQLESYEDSIQNLGLLPPPDLPAKDGNFARDYMLRYWLDFETKGSPSLLNIEWFDDPTAYKMKIKKPGTDEYVEKAVDLVETFNWLIGLHVEHLDRWRSYDAAFKREVDPELPGDTNTRLMLVGALKETDDGAWRFRKVEGYTLRTPGDHNDREKALVVWRKLTGDLEQDNLMLDEWFRKYRLSANDTEFDVIYVNGSNNLPNLRQAEETWKVRLIEEAFHQAMWDVEG